MNNNSLINDLNKGKLNLCFESAAVIEDQDIDIECLQDTIKGLKETNMLLCRDLDEAQRLFEYARGIHL